MKIEAYLDESGIHDKAPACVVAGYYGTTRAWRTFEQQWNRVVDDYPELRATGFHAKDFFARANGERVRQYKGWDDAKAARLLDRLVQAIIRNRIFPIGYAVVVNDFLSLPITDRQWFTGAKFALDGKYLESGCPNKPYYLPFQFCVLDSARMSGATRNEKIDFFAGIDRTFHEYATVLYKYLLADVRIQASILDLLGGMHYPLARETPGLQAADLLVYRLYRHVSEKIAATENLEVPPLLIRLIRNRKPKQRFELFDGVKLRQLQELGRVSYEKLVETGSLPEYLSNLRET
jgi:hypothetical protein